MRRQLIFALLTGVLVVAGIVGAGLYFYVERALTYQFDTALAAKARALATNVHLTFDGYEMESPPETMAEFSRTRRPQYFEVWDSDGAVFHRSPSLGSTDLPIQAAGERPSFVNLKLPDGRDGRAVFLRFQPRPADEDDAPPAGSYRIFSKMSVVVAQSRNSLDEPLNVILGSLFGAAALMCVGVIIVVPMTVRRSLRPLARVADEASGINADSLQHRFSVAQMPMELAPICQRLNDLLERLDGAFARERRFTSDVAHELRTPIAELRSLAEVAIRWPGDGAAADISFRDALEISRHMERMVTTLLALARCESGRQGSELVAVDLNQAIAAAWRTLAASASRRELEIDFQAPANAMVRCDPSLLSSIVSNFLSNAVQYATPKTHIACVVRHVESNIRFSVANKTDSLSQSDLAHLFEPFWRKDAARSPDEHSGLGLALVKAYAGVLHAQIDVTLSASNLFTISIDLPAAAAASQSGNAQPLLVNRVPAESVGPTP